jgi:hypothetical protein
MELRMKRISLLFLGLALAFGTPAVVADTYRHGSQVVSSGDSEGRIRNVLGKPDRETPIETPRGGLEGYRLEYFLDGKYVQVEIINGKVRSITQNNN